jgi:hypothetical protein
VVSIGLAPMGPATPSYRRKLLTKALRPARPDGSRDLIASQQEWREMTPIDLPENCNFAFRLNWSVAVFGQHDVPPTTCWYEPPMTKHQPFF